MQKKIEKLKVTFEKLIINMNAKSKCCQNIVNIVEKKMKNLFRKTLNFMAFFISSKKLIS